MKNFYVNISLNVIAIFVVMMVMSVVPEIVPFDWFFYNCPKETEHDISFSHKAYDSYHWKWRHYIWALMGLALFIVQVIRIVEMCEKKNKE